MTHPHAPRQLTPGGSCCLVTDPLVAAVEAVAVRLADDLGVCAALADVLRRLGRRPEDDADYCRWTAAMADLAQRLATLAGR